MTSAAYQQQLHEKIDRINAQFDVFSPPTLEVFSSPEQHYRMRAEFRVWHDQDDMYYAMFERATADQAKKVIKVEQFPIADLQINQLMPVLIQALKAQSVLRQRLFEVHFLCSLKGEMLVSLIYHRPLDADWEAAAAALAQQLGIKLIGRSRKQKFVFSDEFIIEELEVEQCRYTYKQYENSFTQPNAHVCQKMLGWACEAAGQSDRDMLELYCGNGNFTLPLSKHYRKVLATELAKSSVYAAQWNIEENQIDNIKIARLSAEEFTQAFHAERTFRRLEEAQIEISDYDFETVFVDPPRAGIDIDTLKLLQNFDRIIYISCNPDTLKDNLETLCLSHRISKFAIFDQFPYTHHIECGVVLEKI